MNTYRTSPGAGTCAIVLVLIIALWLAIIGIFTVAWNYVMPYLFNLPHIELLQSAALLTVIFILTSAIRGVVVNKS